MLILRNFIFYRTYCVFIVDLVVSFFMSILKGGLIWFDSLWEIFKMSDGKRGNPLNSIKKTSSDPIVESAIERLKKQRVPDLAHIKESCQYELQRFIDMRGTLDSVTGEIYCSSLTIMENNMASTLKNMQKANDLMKSIKAAHSIDDISIALQERPQSEPIDSVIVDDLDVIIYKCQLITAFAKGL